MTLNLMMGVLPSLKVLIHFGYLPEEGDILIVFILHHLMEKVPLQLPLQSVLKN